jgi:hypothetical protein
MINQWATALKAAGLNVEALDGWQMRAASSYVYEPVGIMLHHTASNRNSGNMPCRNIVVNGRKDLKGPLSQFLIGRNESAASAVTMPGGAWRHALNSF